MTMKEPERAEHEAEQAWRPYCGYHFPLTQMSGRVLVCTRSVHDVRKEKHVNDETGWSWWQRVQ